MRFVIENLHEHQEGMQNKKGLHKQHTKIAYTRFTISLKQQNAMRSKLDHHPCRCIGHFELTYTAMGGLRRIKLLDFFEGDRCLKLKSWWSKLKLGLMTC